MTLSTLSDYQYPLTSLERVKLHLGEEYKTTDDVELLHLIAEVSSTVETICGRHFLSRSWVHDGTTLPRLSSEAKRTLYLPERPITAVASLKLYPGATALTEGWDGDFVVKNDEGVIILNNGNFYEGENIVEITYTAGYLTDPAAALRPVYGYNVKAADLELGVVQLVAWAWHQKKRQREGVASRSEGGVTVTFITDGPPDAWKRIMKYRTVSQ